LVSLSLSEIALVLAAPEPPQAAAFESGNIQALPTGKTRQTQLQKGKNVA